MIRCVISERVRRVVFAASSSAAATSKRPPEERLHKYKKAVSIPRVGDGHAGAASTSSQPYYPSLRGADSATVTANLPHGNPVISAGLSPVKYDMAHLRNLKEYSPQVSFPGDPDIDGQPLIGPEAHRRYLVENTPGMKAVADKANKAAADKVAADGGWADQPAPRRSAAARSAWSMSMQRVLDSRRVSLSARDY